MKHEVRFGTYNPLINFIFFIGAIVLCMFLNHPAFLACSVLSSFSLYFTINKSKALKLLFAMTPVFIIVSLINPLFNIYGKTVLFTFFSDRPYTLEALYYGMANAAMFVSVIMWFASYNEIMTSDKFLYIFGRVAPGISMILTMVLRFIPNYMRKAKQIATARKCIGKAGDEGGKKDKIENGMTVLSSLTNYALEGGIMTADSMQSRGYGCGKRTTFSIYRFDGRDKALTAFMALSLILIIFCVANGAASASYTPDFFISGTESIYTVTGTVFYLIFLMIPTVINVMEEITWHILRSKI